MSVEASASDARLLAVYLDPGRTSRDREAAMLALVGRYERRIHAICYRILGNHADAEEATQDTFLRLARRGEQFRGDARLSTWLFRVATNASTDIARKQARRPRTPVADLGGLADADTAADDELAGAELATGLQAALAELDERSRSLLLLSAVDGYSYPELSAAFDMPVGTVKSRVFRARARLAELLDDGGQPAGGMPAGPGAAQRPADREHTTRARPRAPPAG